MDERLKVAAWFCLGLALRGAAGAVAVEPVSLEQSSFTFTLGGNYSPSISGDGRVVAFESQGRLTPDDTGDGRDVYVYDRAAKKMARVPAAAGFVNAWPTVNGAGRLIAYVSYPPVVTGSTEPRTNNLMLYDRARARSVRVALPRDREVTDAEFIAPRVNLAARFLAFTANGSQLSSENPPGLRQIYLLDRYRSNLELISQSTGTRPGNRPSADPRVSEDGRFVAFRSFSTNLADGRPLESLSPHLYLMDRWEWTLLRVDASTHGFDADGWIVGAYDMDSAGNLIVLEARRRFVGQPFKNLEATDLFVFDRRARTIEHLTKGIFESKSESPTISGDGRYVAFVFRGRKGEMGGKGGLVVYDRQDDLWRRVAEGRCFRPVFARDGSALVFESDDREMHSGAPEAIPNIYVVNNPFREPQP